MYFPQESKEQIINAAILGTNQTLQKHQFVIFKEKMPAHTPKHRDLLQTDSDPLLQTNTELSLDSSPSVIFQYE